MQVFVKSDVTRTVEVAAGATVATVKARPRLLALPFAPASR